ncbi:hypothetical protein HD554DRAFT_848560 [Boletus coccyginus]|nr:hypothetical protein HD554DRAFT_848560 [Boletus coccyginus]
MIRRYLCDLELSKGTFEEINSWRRQHVLRGRALPTFPYSDDMFARSMDLTGLLDHLWYALTRASSTHLLLLLLHPARNVRPLFHLSSSRQAVNLASFADVLGVRGKKSLPTKLNVPTILPEGNLVLDEYPRKGFQAGEEELPDVSCSSTAPSLP